MRNHLQSKVALANRCEKFRLVPEAPRFTAADLRETLPNPSRLLSLQRYRKLHLRRRGFVS